MSGNYRVLYRIVSQNPPNPDDMRSYHELNISLTRHDAEALRLAAGISLYNTFQQAHNQAAKLPPHRRGFIAELRIPENSPVLIERTTPSRGHHTLWGSPDVILSYVVRVVRHDETDTGGAP